MAYRRRYFSTESPVTTQVIAPGAVTSEKIPTGAVTTLQIKNKSIRGEDIADGAIGIEHLGPTVPSIGVIPDNAITESKIDDEAVTNEKIDDGAVTSGKLGAGAVTEIKIGVDAVTTTKVKDASITKAKILDDNVSPQKLEAVDEPADLEVPAFDDATGKFKWTAPAGGGGVQMKTGTFTGDGNATKAITGVGFQPKVVIIMTHAGMGDTIQAMKTDQDATFAQISKGAEMQWDEDIIISLDADGFTIGDFSPMNTSGVVHTYIAFG